MMDYVRAAFIFHCIMRLWATAIVSFCMSVFSALAVDTFVSDRIPVLGSFAGIVRTQNPGIAFGINMPPIIQTLLIGAAVIALTVAAVRSAKTHWQQIGFGLIIGGALGNIADRLPDGSVTDFFQVGSFYIFNMADSCITVGVVVLLIEIFSVHFYTHTSKSLE
ncbi:MAG: lipoprotein signal peptidase [Candidatus Peribacteria bacterium]|nr:lipoprotein signal peptidase [Candidatus Peribacteria bacterium]